MKRVLALGAAALVAVIIVADAQADRNTRIFIRHGGPAELAIDANEDGWVSRTEASGAAERMFAEMDEDSDGRLTAEDRRHAAVFEFSMHEGELAEELEGEAGDDIRREVRREIVRAHRQAERALREAEVRIEQAEREAEDAERMAEDAERRAEAMAEDAERRGDRVVIIRDGERVDWQGHDGHPAIAPLPPMPPASLLLVFANSEEADRNGDGALSRQEFTAQQLRFFDASDANGDGRVRFSFEAPQPPAAPTPPQPPQPAPAPPAPPARR